jgi:hypothetical protein
MLKGRVVRNVWLTFLLFPTVHVKDELFANNVTYTFPFHTYCVMNIFIEINNNPEKTR